MTNEYTAPQINNNLVQSRVLTNTNSAPVSLSLTSETLNLLPLKGNESVLYNNIVQTDPLLSTYNVNIINNYIANDLLIDSTIIPTPPNVSYSGLSGASHTLNSSLIKTKASVDRDLYEICDYVLDVTQTKIKCIAYRCNTGVAYSLNAGNTIIPLPQDGLLYPSEITSVAIQAYPSLNNLYGNPIIYIGTLREGIKSFNIGTDLTWQSFTDSESIVTLISAANPNANPPTLAYYDRQFLFRQSITPGNTYPAPIPTVPEADGNLYDYIPGNYEPVYILNISNYPLGNGIQMLVYTRNTNIDLNTGLPVASYRYLLKYLSSTGYNYTNNNNTGYIQYIETIPQPTLSSTTVNGWFVVDNYAHTAASISDVSYVFPLTHLPVIVDVKKSISFETGKTFSDYFSKLVAVAVDSNTGNYPIQLFKFDSLPHLISSQSQTRSLRITQYADIGSTINIESRNFNGISCIETPQLGIFITTSNQIYRYWNSSWTTWISSQNSLTSLNFVLNGSKSLASSSDLAYSYVEGLLTFSLINTGVLNSYTGIVGTDLGYIKISFVYNNGDFIPIGQTPRSFLPNVFGSRQEDISFVHEINTVLSCGNLITIPISYVLPSTSSSMGQSSLKYKDINPIVSSNMGNASLNIITDIFYKNYTLVNSNTIFHNMYNLTGLSTPNVEQYYDQYLENKDIKVLLTFSQAPTYNNGYTFNFVIPGTNLSASGTQEGQYLYTYLISCNKYNRLKILLQATETLSTLFNNATLISEIEIPYTPYIS